MVPVLSLCTTMGTGAGRAGKREGEAEMVWKDRLEKKSLASFPFTKKKEWAFRLWLSVPSTV